MILNTHARENVHQASLELNTLRDGEQYTKKFIYFECVCTGTVIVSKIVYLFISEGVNLLQTYLNTSNGATMETIKSACTYPISVRDSENAQPKRSTKSSIIAK